mgnify:CR=1 FL=1
MSAISALWAVLHWLPKDGILLVSDSSRLAFIGCHAAPLRLCRQYLSQPDG